MPGLVRKLLIFAAVDGLVLQPAPPRNHKPATDQAIKISYKENSIGPLLKDRRQEDTANETLEAHGVVGLLKVASSSFLISISRREQVALFRGKPVYSISEVAIIPLSSQADAEEAIIRARSAQFRHSASHGDFLGNSSESEDNISLPDDASAATPDPDPESQSEQKVEAVKDQISTVAKDVMTKKGLYGRFTDSWFSKKGWTAESRSRQGLSSEEDLQRIQSASKDPTVLDSQVSDPSSAHAEEPDKVQTEADQIAPTEVAHAVEMEPARTHVALLPKVLTTTKVFFGSRNFFFSYDHDISRSISDQNGLNVLPIHQTFKSQYFWNKHLLQPFLDAGQELFTVPLIQGFVGQREFTLQFSGNSTQGVKNATSDQKEIEETVGDQLGLSGDDQEESSKDPQLTRTFLLTLISRRSVDRAGLRYLRRGIDEDGHVANNVETEQILCSPSWDGANTPYEKLYSYTQIRGSMPLFFSQSPYSLKPIPVFRGSPEDNLAAFKAHFNGLVQQYGRVQAVNLVEKKGNEGKVGALFEELTEKSKEFSNDKDSKLRFEWFDFHQMCKGMKFENVSILFDTLSETLPSFGWTCQRGGDVKDKQSGILRTNCMDCLDRTNVVQSAAGRLVLESQLSTEGIQIDLQHDPTTSWFNTLWADNGDSISRQYAGTAALKGDFTRTRKRNISGALTDFGLTLSRYYNNIVNDYFAQAVIDYLLGTATESIFIDFEADMKGQDYAIDLRKVRQNAIETCTTICVDETTGKNSEHLLAGWVLSCPRISGTIKSEPFEECVLLLTDYSLYFCRMDWGIEKLKSFEKVELESITDLTKGTYITSTLASRDLDEQKNVGFKVTYIPQGKDLVRINTRSLTSNEDDQQQAEKMDKGVTSKVEEKYLAFKALPPRSNFISKDSIQNDPDEQDQIKLISDHIANQVNRISQLNPAMSANTAVSTVTGPLELKVQDKAIVSVEEAKKSTGYLESIGYSLKKLVWAS